MKEIEILVRGVCVKDGKLLLCHTKGAGNMYLPGGHVDFMEAVRHALSREIEEELGLSSEVGRFLGVAEHSFVQEGERCCEVNLVFELDIPGADPAQAPGSCEDHIDFKWVSMEDLDGSDLEPVVLRGLLPDWLEEEYTGSRWGSTLDD